MGICGHKGMPRERQGPPPTPHACMCTFCDRARFRGWLDRARGLAYADLNGKARDALRSEIWDSMIQRHRDGIGNTLASAVSFLYVDEDDDAGREIASLVEDEDELQKSLGDRACKAGCPKGLSAAPEFATVDVRDGDEKISKARLEVLERVGPFVLSPTHQDEHTYTITHERTGFAARRFLPTLTEAVRIAEALAAPGIDWDFDDPVKGVPKATAAHARKVLGLGGLEDAKRG